MKSLDHSCECFMKTNGVLKSVPQTWRGYERPIYSEKR